MSRAARGAEATAGQIYEESAHKGVSTMLSMAAYPVYVYGSGGGALFVPEMDESAFPPLTPPSAPVRIVRRAAQLAFGLRPPT
jgi:hypothetical protein